jgi:hypothetical protein
MMRDRSSWRGKGFRGSAGRTIRETDIPSFELRGMTRADRDRPRQIPFVLKVCSAARASGSRGWRMYRQFLSIAIPSGSRL